MYVNEQVFTTTPSKEGRLEKEMALYPLLEKEGIPFRRVDHEPLNSIEDCKAAESILQAPICKNLLLCNRQKTKFYLLMLPGDKRFVTKNFSKALGVSRCSFAGPEHLMELLHLTPGSVTIFGLLYDTDNKVQLIIDKDLLKEEYIGCHPLINTSTLSVKTSDLLDKFLPTTGHTPIYITLSEEA